jgi:hypothetical protein
MIKTLHFTFLIVFLILFAKCNFTSQSYNTGKLLNPGETLVSVGIGKRGFYSIARRDSVLSTNYRAFGNHDTLFYDSVKSEYDTNRSQALSLCLDYRLGVLRTYPFGKGLEIGFHLEGPYQLNPKNVTSLYVGPVLLEFDGRFGFKDKPLGKGLLHHNLGIGWTIGPWIDNGWYAEYAAGWEYQWLIPYANFRAEWLATDYSTIDSLTESYSPYHYEKRSWTTRTALGISMRIPHWWITPDFIVPEIAVIYPHYSAVAHYGIAYHIALRWLNGI